MCCTRRKYKLRAGNDINWSMILSPEYQMCKVNHDVNVMHRVGPELHDGTGLEIQCVFSCYLVCHGVV